MIRSFVKAPVVPVVPPVDLSPLNNELAILNTLLTQANTKVDYTYDSLKVLYNDEAIYSYGFRTPNSQAQVTAAVNKIQQDINNLVLKPLDLTLINSVLQSAQQLVASDYTPASFSPIPADISKVKAFLAHIPDKTRNSQVQVISNLLGQDMDNLVALPVDKVAAQGLSDNIKYNGAQNKFNKDPNFYDAETLTDLEQYNPNTISGFNTITQKIRTYLTANPALAEGMLNNLDSWVNDTSINTNQSGTYTTDSFANYQQEATLAQTLAKNATLSSLPNIIDEIFKLQKLTEELQVYVPSPSLVLAEQAKGALVFALNTFTTNIKSANLQNLSASDQVALTQKYNDVLANVTAIANEDPNTTSAATYQNAQSLLAPLEWELELNILNNTYSQLSVAAFTGIHTPVTLAQSYQQIGEQLQSEPTTFSSATDLTQLYSLYKELDTLVFNYARTSITFTQSSPSNRYYMDLQAMYTNEGNNENAATVDVLQKWKLVENYINDIPNEIPNFNGSYPFPPIN